MHASWSQVEDSINCRHSRRRKSIEPLQISCQSFYPCNFKYFTLKVRKALLIYQYTGIILNALEGYVHEHQFYVFPVFGWVIPLGLSYFSESSSFGSARFSFGPKWTNYTQLRATNVRTCSLTKCLKFVHLIFDVIALFLSIDFFFSHLKISTKRFCVKKYIYTNLGGFKELHVKKIVSFSSFYRLQFLS